MKVGELIAELQQYNPETAVMFRTVTCDILPVNSALHIEKEFEGDEAFIELASEA